jgi:hypothetical protein
VNFIFGKFKTLIPFFMQSVWPFKKGEQADLLHIANREKMTRHLFMVAFLCFVSVSVSVSVSVLFLFFYWLERKVRQTADLTTCKLLPLTHGM